MVALNCAKHAPSLEEKLKESFGKTARRRYYKESVDVFVALQIRLPPRMRCFQPKLLAISR